ncbi:hypothetical protein [Methylocaldum sp. RMAD-M]|jgi:hypothetical protein|uniref:hypothetical protein n=1 Tax=unclassified Methylocaldum TaxID=2622260 RepID=UPI00111C4943|nr:hypothetical protein [Methylocaldum sp. RMAD-M]MBP1150293.1 hypothetical protein [Methylocaldum sp. RMAD-M]
MKSARCILLALFAAMASAALAESGKRECRFPEDPSYPGNIFEPPAWPMTDLETYSQGRLGVIKPTYDHFYLFIAYRSLAGLPITQNDMERLRPHDPCWYTDARGFYGYEPTAEDKFQSALSEWQRARAKVGAVPEVPTIDTRSSHPEYSFVEFLNCHADAFRNAATVLDNRLSAYGQSPQVLDWVKAQDNEGLPLDELAQIAAMKKLPDKFRRELTLVVWTRAFVLERWDVLRRFAPRIKHLIPEAGRLVDEMLRGPGGNRRRAFGAMLIARYPGMVGNMSDKITYSVALDEFAQVNVRRSMAQDGERENWWCGFPSSVFWAQMGYGTVMDEPPPKFLSPKSIEALRVERQQLRRTSNATDYLSGLVMAWARTAPRDPRLPEALHMLVRSSRGGCIRQPDSGAMFRHLHTYFPGNRWTKITKVHYQ